MGRAGIGFGFDLLLRRGRSTARLTRPTDWPSGAGSRGRWTSAAGARPGGTPFARPLPVADLYKHGRKS
eukprot:8531960-Alexandrium_andersonii.AAC.1